MRPRFATTQNRMLPHQEMEKLKSAFLPIVKCPLLEKRAQFDFCVVSILYHGPTEYAMVFKKSSKTLSMCRVAFAKKLQPKCNPTHKMQLLQPIATRIKICVIIQIRPIILIRKVSEWSVFSLLNIELSHSRGIIDPTYLYLTRRLK